MRKLFLLRHAKSSWDDPGLDDIDRPLSERGRAAAHAMADFMVRQKIRPALVLVSTSKRTRATWDCIEPRMEGVSASIEDCIYEASRGDLLHRLRKVDDHMASVLLVGHNPGIGRLAETLVGHSGEPEALERMAAKFSTGALAEIELDIGHWGEMEAGSGSLVRFVRPKDIPSP
ncbi:histidine phosphatase family protein [Paramagnetospirillum kuznetsovii]|uniref:Histidine phosphatase family protein n=1 Tax=Paramagnetospirillum kuznetsovii TaxID=2053833 RepID=A0A364NVF8_9PROT|nr:histidine phosphatase family protein [Paramagnetospirillum kuznetsovii]RAU21042.1 histidine phosphatase family protein [Paramagnetospirillum kuznetsovii]